MKQNQGAVLDLYELLRKKGCKVVAQPGGSINDEKIISFSNAKDISLYFIKNRLFKLESRMNKAFEQRMWFYWF